MSTLVDSTRVCDILNGIMITVFFTVAGLGVGVGMGFAAAKVYVAKKVQKNGKFSFRHNNVQHEVVVVSK